MMRIVNERLETITEYDLNKGILTQGVAIKENATPIDNIKKFAWYDDDYEEVMVYIPKVEKFFAPTQLDIIEAQVTYTAMMTGTLLEV